MKRTKWFKWKVGAAASLGLALLLQEVRSSAAFQSAVARLAPSNAAADAQAAADSGKPIMDDTTWQSFFPDSQSSQGQIASPQTQGGVHTRTGHS